MLPNIPQIPQPSFTPSSPIIYQRLSLSDKSLITLHDSATSTLQLNNYHGKLHATIPYAIKYHRSPQVPFKQHDYNSCENLSNNSKNSNSMLFPPTHASIEYLKSKDHLSSQLIPELLLPSKINTTAQNTTADL